MGRGEPWSRRNVARGEPIWSRCDVAGVSRSPSQASSARCTRRGSDTEDCAPLPQHTSAPGQTYTCVGTGPTPTHICTGKGLTPATSATGLRSHRPRRHRDWAHPSCHICTGTGHTLPTSVDWAHPLASNAHIHTGPSHALATAEQAGLKACACVRACAACLHGCVCVRVCVSVRVRVRVRVHVQCRRRCGRGMPLRPRGSVPSCVRVCAERAPTAVPT